MRFHKPNIVSVIILGAIAVGLSFLFCRSLIIYNPQAISVEEENHKPQTNIARTEIHNLKDFSFTEYIKTPDRILKKFTLRGKRMGVESKKFGIFRVAAIKEVCIKDAQLIFYEDNVPVSYVTAKKAVSNVSFDLDSASDAVRKMEFSGGVSLITEDKRTLVCDNMKWQNREDCLLASGDCILRYEGRALKADVIETDVKLRNFKTAKSKKKGLLKRVARLF